MIGHSHGEFFLTRFNYYFVFNLKYLYQVVVILLFYKHENGDLS